MLMCHLHSSGDGGADPTCIQTRITFDYGNTWTQPLASQSDCAAALGASVAMSAGTNPSNNPCALQVCRRIVQV
jgi:hypothetical protein